MMSPRRSWKPKARRRGDYAGGGDAWRTLSRSIKDRDGQKCRFCGKTRKETKDGRLEVHHIRALSKGGTDAASNLVTICSECHAKQPGHGHMARRRKK